MFAFVWLFVLFWLFCFGFYFLFVDIFGEPCLARCPKRRWCTFTESVNYSVGLYAGEVGEYTGLVADLVPELEACVPDPEVMDDSVGE